MSDDLVEWLRAQLDEDERIAQAIDAKEWKEESSWFKDMLDPLPSQRRERPTWLPMITVEDIRHISRHDPARVLRDVAAGFKLIAAYEEAKAYYDAHPEAPAGELTGLRTAIQILAAIFDDRDGYRAEWAP